MHICNIYCLTQAIPPYAVLNVKHQCIESLYIDIISGHMAPQFYLNLMMAYELMGRSP